MSDNPASYQQTCDFMWSQDPKWQDPTRLRLDTSFEACMLEGRRRKSKPSPLLLAARQKDHMRAGGGQ